MIVSGQSWQFKGWKWKFPLEVFKKGRLFFFVVVVQRQDLLSGACCRGVVCGVYIYNQGSQLNAEIKQWDVKVLMVWCGLFCFGCILLHGCVC